jgi:phosphoglycerol transferase MdoB-like AlkP superfamily enzyme
MRNHLFFLGKLALLWLIFFFAQRILFIFHFWADFEGNYTELLQMPFVAFRLDLSALAYVIGVPFILSLFGFFLRNTSLLVLNRVIQVFVWITLSLSALITAGEIVTYIEWKTKLSSKIFIHFATPLEIFRTASAAYTAWFIFYVIVQLIVAYLVYHRLFKGNKIKEVLVKLHQKFLYAFGYLIFFAGVLILFIRGGVQQIPVSATDAYYSKKQIVNDVTVNPVWNFIHMTYVYLKVDLSVYFKNLPPSKAEQINSFLYKAEGVDTTKLFKTNNPNIILVTLEGWSAQMIEPLGGLSGITPHFNALCDEGYLFTEIYATGGTSETGNSSIISGYPTISGISISTESAKCRQLPSINKSLKAKGYGSFYTFGGSLSYGNLGGYLTEVGFDEIVDENNLELDHYGKLGYHDEAMFPYFLGRIQNAPSPFFYALFTQSTHSPYDMIADPVPGYENDLYVTSMHYADFHLNKFMDEIKAMPNYENTLVIFIADHGRANPVNQNTYHEDYFHIPLLFVGGALKESFRGARNERIGSQADLAKTLLNQFDLPTEDFHWSKDLLNPSTKEWAICTSTLSYGWKDEQGYTVYHMIEDRLIQSPYNQQHEIDSVLQNCRAVLEMMYAEFQNM